MTADSAWPDGAFCGIIDESTGQLLWLRSARTGLWELPGGQLEPVEQAVDGCVREVFEETGARIDPEQLSPVAEYFCVERSNNVSLFAARVNINTITLSDEHDQFAWLPADSAHPECSSRWQQRSRDLADWNAAPLQWVPVSRVQ